MGQTEATDATRQERSSDVSDARLLWISPQFVSLAILLVPFAYYGFVLATRLVPSHYPDTFAYVWRGRLNWHFLTGRSLTQRALFSLSNKSNLGIAAIQLTVLLATELYLYFLLRARRTFHDWLLALAIAFIFASYSLNVSAAAICAEVTHVALVLLFPVVMMRSRRPFAIVCIGALYIFSKNSAPYSALVVLACAVAIRIQRSPAVARSWAGVSAIAVVSIAITSAFDTSTELNVLDNASTRIFPRAEITRLFHDKYGMPIGPFVQACAGGNVTTPCFDGESLLAIDAAARNYVLREDRYGFVRWARSRGVSAYARYLLLDDPRWTAREFRRAFEEHFANETVKFLIAYLDAFPDGPGQLSNLARLAKPDGSRQDGFLGFDPLVALRNGVEVLGFGSHWGLACWLAVALALVVARRTESVALALVLLGNALALFFLGYFGGGMEFERHVVPAIIGYVIGAVVLVIAVVGRLLSAPIRVHARVRANP